MIGFVGGHGVTPEQAPGPQNSHYSAGSLREFAQAKRECTLRVKSIGKGYGIDDCL